VGRDDPPKQRGHPIVAASGATGRARDARLIEARRLTVEKRELASARDLCVRDSKFVRFCETVALTAAPQI
jgi:hypothetical protein